MSQVPSSLPPQSEDHGFDPLAFWIQYRSAIRGSVALLLAAMVGYAGIELVGYQRRQAAAEAFAAAKTPEQLSSFIQNHRGMPAAGNAALLLAGKQRTDGQIEAALATLNEFIAKSPEHPMTGSAHLALASILEQQGKTEEAVAAYRRLLAVDSRGVTAPVALLRLARIHRGLNKLDEAKALYESLQSQFPNSAFAAEALQEGQQLAPSAVLQVPAAPAPAPGGGEGK